MTSRVNLKTLQLVFKMVGKKKFTMTVNNIIVVGFFFYYRQGRIDYRMEVHAECSVITAGK